MNRSTDGPTAAAATCAADAKRRIPLVEAAHAATTRPAEPGEVRIAKLTTGENGGLEVPVTDEAIRVERRVVERPTETAGMQAFEQIVIEMPIAAGAAARLDAPAMEEIVVRIQTVRRIERVTDTVRREDVSISEIAAPGAGTADASSSARSDG